MRPSTEHWMQQPVSQYGQPDNEGHSMVAAPVIDDCRNMLADFGKVTIEHCNRESNMVAHVLAQWGRSNPSSLWLEEPPNFIASSLGDDVAGI